MIISKDDYIYVIYIYKSYYDLDIFNYDDISFLLKKVFIKLNRKYNLMGTFYIDIYVNDEFGIIMEINNIDNNLNYFDVKVKIHLDSLFLNEILYDKEYNDIYFYNNKYYTFFNKKIDGNIIYKDVLDIINKGIKVK